MSPKTDFAVMGDSIRSPARPTPAAEVGMSLADVDTPALLIDLDAFETNLWLMQESIAGFAGELRPHAKTHKCPTIALAQIAHGAVGVCCQKVSEAEALVDGGVGRRTSAKPNVSCHRQATSN